MATYGDPRQSRFKTRRIAKRSAVFLLFLIAAVVAVLSALVYGITSEAFWRRYILPQYFGPYWDTAIRWESFEPTVFPPGAAFGDLELVEPNTVGKPFLHIKRLRVELTSGSRPSKLDFRRMEVEGIDLHLVLYSRDETNFTRIIARLFEGRNPSATEHASSHDEVSIPHILLNQFEITPFKLEIEDRRFGPDHINYVYTATEPVKLDFTPFETVTGRGRLDEFLRLRSKGDFTTKWRDLEILTKGTLTADIPDLANFPNTTAKVNAILSPADGSPGRLDLALEMPLNRLPIRVSATPLQKVDISCRLADDAEPWLHLRDMSLDPLSGELAAHLALKGEAAPMLRSLRAFLSPASRPPLDAILAREEAWTRGTDPARPLTLSADIDVTGQGVAQYAIVDEQERLPLKIQSSGSVYTTNVPVQSLGQLDKVLNMMDQDSAPATAFTADIDYHWSLDADEAGKLAHLRAEANARPAGMNNDDILFSLSLTDTNDPTQPVRFNPFQKGLWEALKTPAARLQEGNLPLYPVFPGYEGFLDQLSHYLSDTTELLDELDLENASFRQRLSIRDASALRALVSPVLGDAIGAATGEVSFTATRIGEGKPSRWGASFHINDLELKDISDKIGLHGNAEFVREEETLTASDLELKIYRRSAEGQNPLEFSLGLPRSGREGTVGPVTPTYINLVTGEGHFELMVNTIRREFMEILLRVQTFGLSTQLADPFYQRLLNVLGFRPDDPNAHGQADVYMTGDIREVVRLSTLLNVRNIPVANFLMRPDESAARTERFDARFAQMFALDRRTMMLRPEEFELRLRQPGIADPFAILRLDADPETTFDYQELRQFTAGEAGRFTEGDKLEPSTLKQLAAGLFERTARLRKAVRGPGGRVVFLVPGLELGDWKQGLRSSGVPIESGKLTMSLEAALAQSDKVESETLAKGAFHVSNLLLTGAKAPVPSVDGNLEIISAADKLTLRDLSTSLALDPAYPPTSIRFNGEADVNSFASTWTLSIEQVNGAVLRVLQEMDGWGLASATNVLNRLPSGLLGEMAGERGTINLHFDAATDPLGQTVSLAARQTGTELRLLSSILEPLAFEASQQLEYRRNSGAFTLARLHGMVTENGTTSPLLNFSLSDPVTIGDPSAAPGETATFTISAKKNLREIAQRLHSLPLPLFDRAIEQGTVEGELQVRIPRVHDPANALQSHTDFRLALRDLTLTGLEDRYDGALTGTISSDGTTVRLDDTVLAASVGGADAGALQLQSVYTIATQQLDSTLDLIDLRSSLLVALPPRLAEWASKSDSTLNLHGAFQADFLNGKGRADVTTRVRNVGLPALRLPDGTDFQHPPLDVDMSFVSSYDRPTSTVMLMDFAAKVAEGGVPGLERLSPIPTDRLSLLQISQLAPIIIDADRNTISPDNVEGAGLLAQVGPVDLALYGGVLRQLFGVPLVAGTLQGNATVVATGVPGGRIDSGKLELTIDEATWQDRHGESFPLTLSLAGAGGRREGAWRLDDFRLRALHPQRPAIPEDSLTARGFYTTATAESPRQFELDVASDSLCIDRLIEMAADIEHNRAALPKSKTTTPGPTTPAPPVAAPYSLVPDRLRASVRGQFRNLIYREVAIPSIHLKADLDDNHLHLKEFRSRLAEGDVLLKGNVDFGADVPPWDLSLAVNDLEARPWIDSFAAPQLRGTITGRLDGQAELAGQGFTTDALAQTLKGRIRATLTRGKFENEGFRKVVGDEADVALNGNALIRNNQAHFRLETPWNPSRDLLVQGWLRPLLPATGETSHLHALMEATRMTAVGPPGREVSYKGVNHPFRQPVAGLLVEIDGPLGGKDGPKASLRSLNY
jgi:hypothetical protein